MMNNRNWMRTLLCLCLALGMVFTLCACGGTGETPGGETPGGETPGGVIAAGLIIPTWLIIPTGGILAAGHGGHGAGTKQEGGAHHQQQGKQHF